MRTTKTTTMIVAPTVSRAQVVFRALQAITFASLGGQLILDLGYDNMIAAILVACSSSITFYYIRSTRALDELPLSTFSLLGLCITTQWGALVGQTALWTPMTQNLRLPVVTFAYLFGFQLIAIAAHLVSRKFAVFSTTRAILSAQVLAPLGVLRVPAVPAVWAIGVLGLGATLLAGTGDGGLFSKIAGGLSVLAWAPFAIPMLFMRYGAAYCHLPRHVPFLIIFVVLAMLLGTALNARSIIFVGGITAVLLLFLFMLTDERPFEWKSLKRIAWLVLIAAILFEPLSRFAWAVQAAREYRGRVSSIDLIKETYYAFVDTDSARRQIISAGIDAKLQVYDEYYFTSPLIGRLVETKFHDSAFFMVQGVRPQESKMISEDAVDRVWSVLPYPVLKWFGEEKSKLVTLYSVGDFLAYLRFGMELGGFKTGSMFAQGVAIFGAWAPVLYLLACLPIFILWDMLSIAGRNGKRAEISFIGMLLIYRVFAHGIVSESISGMVEVLVRTQVQNILLYALVFMATRAIWNPFDPSAVRRPLGMARLPRRSGGRFA